VLFRGNHCTTAPTCLMLNMPKCSQSLVLYVCLYKEKSGPWRLAPTVTHHLLEHVDHLITVPHQLPVAPLIDTVSRAPPSVPALKEITWRCKCMSERHTAMGCVSVEADFPPSPPTSPPCTPCLFQSPLTVAVVFNY
jgi:hypothetical protein